MITFRLLPGAVTLPGSGPILPAAVTTWRPASQSFSTPPDQGLMKLRILFRGAHGNIDDPDPVFFLIDQKPVHGPEHIPFLSVSPPVQHLQGNDAAAGSHAAPASAPASSAGGGDARRVGAVAVVIVGSSSPEKKIPEAKDPGIKIYMRKNTGVQESDADPFSP